MSRLSRIMSLAALPTAPSDILLKVCPTCKLAQSKYEDFCVRCSKKAEEISKVSDLKEKEKAGETLTNYQESKLSYLPGKIQWFLDNIVRMSESQFLEHAPFELPTELIGVNPSFTNRLTFFMDRMREEGKNVVSTKAATKLLNSVDALFSEKFNKKDKKDKKDIIKTIMSNREFVNFAFKYGVKPVMSADGEHLYAAWKAEDVVNLYNKYKTERTIKDTTKETSTEKHISSAEAATILGATTPKTFTDFAAVLGIPPAKSMGEMPEQKAWYKEDVMALRSIWGIESEVREMEAAIERITETIKQLENDIKQLNGQNLKWNEMQKLRNKEELLVKKEAEIAKLHNGIKVLLAQREQKAAAIRQIAEKRLKPEVLPTEPKETETPKEASMKRLMRIITLS